MAFYKYPETETVNKQPCYPNAEQHENDNQVLNSNYANVFFFPGITGEGCEAYFLAKELYERSGGKRRSYVYYEPEKNTSPISQNKAEEPENLKAKARKIAKSIKELQSFYPNYPYILINYSFGCALGYEVAQCLEEINNEKKDIFLIQIDGTTPSIMKQYYNQTSDETISDIIKIINYAANTAGYKPQFNILVYHLSSEQNLEIEHIKQLSENKQCLPVLIKHNHNYYFYGLVKGKWILSNINDHELIYDINFPKEGEIYSFNPENSSSTIKNEIKKLHTHPAISYITRSLINEIINQQLPLNKQIERLSEIVTKQDVQETILEKFKQNLSIAIENLSYITNNQFSKPSSAKRKDIPIEVFSTDHTYNKYKNFTQDDCLGWSEYSNQTSALAVTTDLKTQPHIALLNKQNASILADCIHQYIDSKLSVKYFLNSAAQILANQLNLFIKSYSLENSEHDLVKSSIDKLVEQTIEQYSSKEKKQSNISLNTQSFFNIQPNPDTLKPKNNFPQEQVFIHNTTQYTKQNDQHRL